VRRTLARADEVVSVIERALIVGLLAVMAGAVFLDALHRVFSAEEGRLERLLVALAPAAAERAVRTWIAPAVLLLAAFGVAYGALRTRRARRPLLLAAVLTAALTGLVQFLVRGLPNGLVWSQQMALCFMLWVGLMGASLGTRDRSHIAFELAGKLWPARLRRPAEFLARLLSAAFALFLAFLAAAFAREHYAEWSASGGEAGLFEAFRVPRFLIYGFLPFPLTVMGLRFLGYGVRAIEEEPA
jgi:TRAP-type C4-dicarboxylate transport system permease small subunit